MTNFKLYIMEAKKKCIYAGLFVRLSLMYVLRMKHCKKKTPEGNNNDFFFVHNKNAQEKYGQQSNYVENFFFFFNSLFGLYGCWK